MIVVLAAVCAAVSSLVASSGELSSNVAIRKILLSIVVPIISVSTAIERLMRTRAEWLVHLAFRWKEGGTRGSVHDTDIHHS
jgi:hypothetical protein